MSEPSGRRIRLPAAWQRRGFRQLAAAWIFTNLADSALYLMVSVWVKELSGSDAAAALVFAALGLAALSAPFLGQLADRVSRKRLLVASNLLMAPVVLTLILVGSERELWLVYLVVFVYGCSGYLTAAAQSGLIRDLLPDAELAAGNGMLSTIDQVFRLGSPLLGTVLYVAAGPLAVVGLTAACFVITSALLAGLRITETEPEPVTAGYWRELTAGFAHLVSTSPLGRLTVTIAVAFGATGLLNAAVFPIMEQGLGVGPELLGVLVTVQGVGAVVGGMVSASLVTRLGERRSVTIGVLVLAVGCLPLLGSSLPFAVAGLALVGFSIPVMIVAFVTVRQRLTAPGLQGRVSAASNISINLPQTAVTVVGAALLGVTDYRWLIAVTALVVAASALLTLGHGRQPEGGTAPA